MDVLDYVSFCAFNCLCSLLKYALYPQKYNSSLKITLDFIYFGKRKILPSAINNPFYQYFREKFFLETLIVVWKKS